MWPDGSASTRAALLWRSLTEDWVRLRHNVLVNRMAASALMPRIGRLLILRRAGMDIKTGNMYEGTTIAGTNLAIGEGTFLNRRCFLEALGHLRIGARCLVGMEAMVLTTTHRLTPEGTVHPDPVQLATTIEDDCWLGARSIVAPGVVVARGCVIAAGAVVVGDTEPYGMYGGVPARRLRDLRPAEMPMGGSE